MFFIGFVMEIFPFACLLCLLNSYFGIVKESFGDTVSSTASVDSDTRQLMPLQKRCREILFFVMFVNDAIQIEAYSSLLSFTTGHSVT
jgi:hypothetical protein